MVGPRSGVRNRLTRLAPSHSLYGPLLMKCPDADDFR